MYNLIANAANVILNYFLIFGIFFFPKLGIYGAAIATSVSKVIAFILALLMLFCVKTDIRVKLNESFFIHKNTVKRIAEVGITAALEQLIMQTGFAFFTKTVSILPTDIFSAHHISLNINGLAWVPSQAFGVASTSLVGQCVGRGDKDKAKSYANVIHLMSLGVAVFIGVMFILFSKYIVMIYTNEPSVIDAASQVLRIIALGMPGIGTQIPVAAALRGAKDTKIPLLANLISVWIFRVIVCNIFLNVFHWGIIGAWVTIVLDQTCRAVIVYTRFLRGKWLNKKIST
jgi:putative MATE family efflux protein